MRHFLALLLITVPLAACQEDYGQYENGSVYGEDDRPVYTEGTPDETFKRIDERAGG